MEKEWERMGSRDGEEMAEVKIRRELRRRKTPKKTRNACKQTTKMA